jgi:hypothetical protein
MKKHLITTRTPSLPVKRAGAGWTPAVSAMISIPLLPQGPIRAMACMLS